MMALYGEADTVAATSLSIEIPFVNNNGANSLLVLSEKEGKTIRSSDEEVCAAARTTILGKLQ
jgi:hypothetical protein